MNGQDRLARCGSRHLLRILTIGGSLLGLILVLVARLAQYSETRDSERICHILYCLGSSTTRSQYTRDLLVTINTHRN